MSLGSIAVMPNLASAILVGAIGGLGVGLSFTQWSSLLQRASPDAERGTTFAIAETLEQVAFVGGMVVAGFVVDAVGPQPTYLVPGALLLAATAVSSTVTVGTTPVMVPLAAMSPLAADEAPAQAEAT